MNEGEMMKHMTNKEVIYEAVYSMKGRPFTMYDIRDACTRNLALQSISCIIKGMPGIQKIEHDPKGCSTWILV